jgi:energy-converting hydrogenase Eha subunit C
MTRGVLLRAVALLCLAAFLGAGCVHPRYQMPAVLAIGGGAMTVGGASALVPLHDNPMGRVSAISVMTVGVIALVAASIWLGVKIRCTTTVDCPEGETCTPVPTSGGQSYGVCQAQAK